MLCLSGGCSLGMTMMVKSSPEKLLKALWGLKAPLSSIQVTSKALSGKKSLRPEQAVPTSGPQALRPRQHWILSAQCTHTTFLKHAALHRLSEHLRIWRQTCFKYSKLVCYIWLSRNNIQSLTATHTYIHNNDYISMLDVV